MVELFFIKVNVNKEKLKLKINTIKYNKALLIW